MSVAFFTHADCLAHEMGPGHPESPDRLRAILRVVERPEFAELERLEAPAARRADLLRAHPAGYVDSILGLDPAAGELIPLDPDTFVGAGTVQAALRAAGAAVAAAEAVVSGRGRAAFVATRPPGHHAEPAQAMGFCFFANAAIAALAARDALGVGRVAVVDFDVHHGNGTAAILRGEAGMFYASSHQYPAIRGRAPCFPCGWMGAMCRWRLAPAARNSAPPTGM